MTHGTGTAENMALNLENGLDTVKASIKNLQWPGHRGYRQWNTPMFYVTLISEQGLFMQMLIENKRAGRRR